MYSVPVWNAMCQCPITGNHHFYEFDWFNCLGSMKASVNALERAIIISTRRHRGKEVQSNGCQCPITGNHHFYMKGINEVIVYLKGVNALERAIIISTRTRLFFVRKGVVCVNAL